MLELNGWVQDGKNELLQIFERREWIVYQSLTKDRNFVVMIYKVK